MNDTRLRALERAVSMNGDDLGITPAEVVALGTNPTPELLASLRAHRREFLERWIPERVGRVETFRAAGPDYIGAADYHERQLAAMRAELEALNNT